MSNDKNNRPTSREAQDGYRHVLKYTGIFGGVQGLKILMNIVRTKLTSIFLGSYGMGLNAIFQKIGELINSSTNLGLSFSSLRSLSELYDDGTDEQKRHFILLIRTWCMWTSLVGGLLCLVLAPLFSCFFFPTGASLLHCYLHPLQLPHLQEILLLSLFVAAMPIEAGECSILKGLRQLKSVAKIETLCAMATFLLTIPFYYLLGVRGIVISLVMTGIAMSVIHLCYSCRLYRYQVSLLSGHLLREGWPLVKVGVPYVLAAIVGAAASGLIFRSISAPDQIGLFQAGYNLMVTYAGMVFVAIETDFFPRLSAVNHDRERMNYIINQQIDVCVALMTPMLIMMALFMPIILYLLYTTRFLAIVPMAVLAVFHMFFKSITLPIAYTPLAKGDSHIYLLMEVIYDVAYFFFITLAYKWGTALHFSIGGETYGGLAATGVALSAAGLFDFLLIAITYGWHYHFRFRRQTIGLIFCELLCLCFVVPFCFLDDALLWKCIVGGISLIFSFAIAWHYIKCRR